MFEVIVKVLEGMGGSAVGIGLGLYSLFQFIRWAFEFAARRIDQRESQQQLREDKLTAREEKADKHLGLRVSALERELRESKALVTRYHRAVIILSAEVEVIHPMSPRLAQVRDLLAGVVPIASPDVGLDALMEEAGNALDR